MSEETKTIKTKVEKVDVNLDEIFNGAPVADSITLPDEDSKKPNIFNRKQDVDLSFIDNPVEETTEEEVEETVAETAKKEEVKKDPVSKEQIDELLGDNQEEEDNDDEKTETKKRGRKPINGIADVFNKLIADDKIVGFDDGKDLTDYSAKDFEELIQANLDERANAVRRETPKQFLKVYHKNFKLQQDMLLMEVLI